MTWDKEVDGRKPFYIDYDGEWGMTVRPVGKNYEVHIFKGQGDNEELHVMDAKKYPTLLGAKRAAKRGLAKVKKVRPKKIKWKIGDNSYADVDEYDVRVRPHYHRFYGNIDYYQASIWKDNKLLFGASADSMAKGRSFLEEALAYITAGFRFDTQFM